jgi:predicted ATP-grasp superfamily ATP-dependent carboligase
LSQGSQRGDSSSGVFKYVADAIDLEFFLVVSDEEEARKVSIEIVRSLGLPDPDVVFVESMNSGSRVRVRSYINRVGSRYSWLSLGGGGEKA